MPQSSQAFNSQWARCTSHPATYIAANSIAAFATAGAVFFLPRPLKELYPTALTWIPTAAFSGAALSCWKLLAPWMSFIALGLNVASLVVFFLAGYAAITDARVGLAGLSYVLAGAALATWNLVHVSTGVGHN